MLDCKMVLEEVSENDRLVDTEGTIRGLQMAGMRLVDTVKNADDEEYKNDGIESLNAIISAMAYISIMHGTVRAIRTDLRDRKGGSSC
jgi:hypothetical protein